MKWITTTDLNTWAPKRDAQENMPLLIRKLLRAEANTLTKLFFPAGENIVLKGWDGILHADNKTEKIPAGTSVFEIGCRKDYQDKAQEDYKSRTADPKGVDPSKTTLIMVTPYTWSDKGDWETKKKADRIWMDVQVWDAQELEHLIEKHPAIGFWLAKYLGKSPDVESLDDFWDTWHKGPDHTIPSEMVLAGRQKASEDVINLLMGTAASLIVKASTQEEVIAFVAATINETNKMLQEDVYSRALIVETEEQFKELIVHPGPLILLTKFEDKGTVNKAIRNGHHVIIVTDYASTVKGAITLSRLRREGFEKGLQTMGYSWQEASALNRDCAQSLSVLRRRLQFVYNQQPEWAKNNNHIDIVPALLAGYWNNDKEGDRRILSLLAGEDYEAYIDKLSRWKLHRDPAVLQIGRAWKITSALDAISIIAPLITKQNFERLKEACNLVLNEVHPAFDLKPEERMMASLLGKDSIYSPELKTGLCQTLVLIGVFGESFNMNELRSPQYFVNDIVQNVLKAANGKKLCSLHYYLPSLAEAAPEAFLQELENALQNNLASITEMFEESPGILSPNSHHTGLLWALENLTGSISYLLRVTLLLGRLTQMDPGGRLSNRPINSLREIFVPWLAQIDVPIATRKPALQKLAADQPQVAWDLFIKLMPGGHAVAHPLHKCHWRYNLTVEYKPTYEEIFDFYSFLFDWLLAHAGKNPDKILILVGNIANLSPHDRLKLLTHLKAIHSDLELQKEDISDKLRNILVQHRSHAGQEWALPEKELVPIEEVFKLYEPVAVTQKYLYLFKDRSYDLIEDPKDRELSHDARSKLIDDMRAFGLTTVYADSGIDGIVEMSRMLSNAFLLGRIAALIETTESDEEKIISLLQSEEQNIIQFTRGFVVIKNNILGETWGKAAWEKIQKMNFTERGTANFFLAMPQCNPFWKMLEQASSKAQELYWKEVDMWFNQTTLDSKLYAIEKLHQFNRHITVLDKITYYLEEMPSERLLDVLVKAGTLKSEEDHRTNHRNVEEIFKCLQERNDVDKSRIAQLEWLYIDVLADIYSTYTPVNLEAEISTNPTFFVELLTLLARPDDSDGSEDVGLSDEELDKRYRLAVIADKLLGVWRLLPGTQPDKTIDTDALKNWLKEARQKAAEANRSKKADYKIGKLLGRQPKNPTSWPIDIVSEVLDSVGTDEILSAFKTEVRNSRSSFTKSVYEGGQQERNISAYYAKMAQQIALKWPKTSAVLKQLAEEYHYDARRADESAELDELRF